MKLKSQAALEQAEKKKRKLEANPYSFTSPAPAARSSSTSRPRSVDQSTDSDQDIESMWDATNGAMQEIYINLKNKRIEQQPTGNAVLNAKDRVELLNFLLTYFG